MDAQEQPVPEVTMDDVDRILERDFSADDGKALRAMIEVIRLREKTRTVLACLRNSGGDLSRAEKELRRASEDWREVIVDAEYPNYSKKTLHIDDVSPEERQKIYELDWEQYSTWLYDDA